MSLHLQPQVDVPKYDEYLLKIKPGVEYPGYPFSLLAHLQSCEPQSYLNYLFQRESREKSILLRATSARNRSSTAMIK